MNLFVSRYVKLSSNYIPHITIILNYLNLLFAKICIYASQLEKEKASPALLKVLHTSPPSKPPPTPGSECNLESLSCFML